METLINTLGDAILPFLVAVIFSGVGVFSWWSDKRVKRLCTSVAGGVVEDEGYTVVKHKREQPKEGYRPTFSYLVEGVKYTTQPKTMYETRKFSMGQKVTVFYDPFKPSRSYALEAQTPRLVIWIPTIFGGFVLLIGLIIYLVS
jgi:Protein of unknown function (DUF3592).